MQVDENFKVEVGQEWKTIDDADTFIIGVISSNVDNLNFANNFYYTAHGYSWNNKTRSKYFKIDLTNYGTIKTPELFEYLGTATKCEDCKSYCNQSNCRFGSPSRAIGTKK